MPSRTTTLRLRPTTRAWGLFIAGAVLVIVAFLVGRRELLALGIFLAALPVCALGLRALLSPRLEIERTVFPLALAVGERVRVVSEVRNRAVAGFDPASYLDLTPGAGRAAIGGVLPRLAGRLHPRETRRRRRIAYSLGSMRRGIHAIGPLYLENVDGLGLTRRVIELGEAVDIEVHPRIHPVDALDVPATRSGGEVEAGVASQGDSDDVLTREYRRGDPMRRVHWKASARSGELRVRQEEHHAEVSSLVVLDTAAAPDPPPAAAAPETVFELMAARGSVERTPPDPVFEQAVSIAASLIARLHELGYETDYFETHVMGDGVDDPRIGGTRVSADEPLDAIMRHLMLVEPVTAEAPRDEAIDALASRAARLGRSPIFLVHRACAGDQLERLLALAASASPGVCVLVANGAPAVDVRRIDAAGWQIVAVDASAPDPWATARPLAAAERPA